MKRKYLVKDQNQFIRQISKIVDQTVSLPDLKSNPWAETGEYIGSVNWGKILIYGYGKMLFGRRLLLKLSGSIDNANNLYITVSFRLKYHLVFQTILGIWLIIILTWSFSWLLTLGLGLATMNIIWTSLNYFKSRDTLLKRIEEIIEAE